MNVATYTAILLWLTPPMPANAPMAVIILQVLILLAAVGLLGWVLWEIWKH